ncbi:MAG: diaminopimelate decarboxylase, partial [Acidobacteriota bacterium]|nr:diaminopimelate decarboxylase [Acidobacteriota bacterium]
MATEAPTGVSPVFPIGTTLNALGHLEVGGCDLIELAREFGTPAYVVAEDDLHERARAYLDGARAAHGGGSTDADVHAEPHVDVVYASKAFPCTAVLELFAGEGLWCDVASGGELHLALGAGFPPARLVVHGNAKSLAELTRALEVAVGLIVIDNFDEIERLAALVAAGALGDRASQRVLVRATPDVRGETHAKISTGQADSKFGFSLADLPRALERVNATAGLELRGLHAHVGSQLSDLTVFERAARELSAFGHFPVFDLGGGLAIPYTGEQRPPSIAEYMAALREAARRHLAPHEQLLVEPGRSLTGSSCVTLYTVESVKRNVST